MDLRDKLLLRPDTRITLADRDPGETMGLDKEAAAEKTEKNIARLDELQYLMYGEHRRALLVVLQGMDGAGKDGTIRHVMRGLNPQGCRVTSFKAPSAEEAEHDFLWRVHRVVPSSGEVAIFNRSHYEDVLAARVRKLVPKTVWTRRYDHINRFEQLLTDSDFEDRKHWDDYVAAYEDALTRCSTSDAPWFIVPADKKWFRNFAVSRILVETLEALDMRFPKPTVDVSRITPSLSSGRG